MVSAHYVRCRVLRASGGLFLFSCSKFCNVLKHLLCVLSYIMRSYAHGKKLCLRVISHGLYGVKQIIQAKKSIISLIVLRKCPVVKSYVAKESAVKIVECNNARISVNFIFLRVLK